MSQRPANRFELFTCGWAGHVLVGTDAARITGADAALVRQIGDLRWYHCLRCYDWVAMSPPPEPGRPLVPGRDVLRLSACDRAVHVTVLAVLAVVIFFVAGNHDALQRDYTQVVDAF